MYIPALTSPHLTSSHLLNARPLTPLLSPPFSLAALEASDGAAEATAVLRRCVLALAPLAGHASPAVRSAHLSLLVGVLRWWQVLVVPATYLVMMLPAALAGRPLPALLTIYLQQFDYYQFLSMNAPNPWMLVDLLLPGHYALGTRLGLGLAAVGGLGLVWACLRCGRHPAPATLLLMLTASLALLPFLLPKMHERYFFPAACFGYLLAVARPALWPVAVLLQLANVITYRAFLLGRYEANWASVLPMTLAVALLLRALWREPRRVPEPVALGSG